MKYCEKKCIICQKPFPSYHGMQLSCSPECAKERNKIMFNRWTYGIKVAERLVFMSDCDENGIPRPKEIRRK